MEHPGKPPHPTPEPEHPYAHRMAAIAEIGRAVTSILDLPAQLRALVDGLQQGLGYYGANVWILTEPAEAVQLKGGLAPDGQDLSLLELQLPVRADAPAQDHPGASTGAGNGILWVCQSGAHYLVEDLHRPESLALGQYFPQARAQLVLPLKVGPKRIGALEIISRRPGAFSQDDIVLLRSLADQATIAIRNATLYGVEQSRRRLAETSYQISQALSSTIRLDEVLELILKLLDEIVPADRLSVMLREGDELEFVARRGFPAGLDAAGIRVHLQQDGIYSQIFTTRAPLVIADAQLHPDWQQMEGLPAARSWLGVPLITNNQVIGMLSLAREHLLPYTYAEVTLTMTFAGQAALALENARLYDRLARFNQQLEERVQERTEQLRSAYDKLERLDQTKTNFIRVTSHELRTPLTVLLGYSQMMIQNPRVAQDAMLSQLADGIYSGADRLHDIVNSMLDIVKIDSAALELSPEPVSLDLVLRNVAGNFKNALRHREINLQIDNLNDLPRVIADGAALQKVFYQLLSNAIKYTPNGGSIRIDGRSLPGGERVDQTFVEVTVSDSGIGIDPAQQELIFTKFYQTGEVQLHSSSRTQFKGGGPGLGLPIARGIVQAHGGRLWVESSGHDEHSLPGSSFHILLPALTQDAPGAA
ncbi:MAG: GAF domain-containing protein [Chloroflexota bacterium]